MKTQTETTAYFVDDEYFVTALVPSETACLASSPGRISRTLSAISQKQSHGIKTRHLRGLDLSGGNGGLLVVCGEFGCLSCNTLEDICQIC